MTQSLTPNEQAGTGELANAGSGVRSVAQTDDENTQLGSLVNELIQLNIWRYHPPGANPTNGDVYKYERRIDEIVAQLDATGLVDLTKLTGERSASQGASSS